MASELRVDRIFPGAFELDADRLRAFETLLARHLGTQPKCDLELNFGRRSENASVDEMLEAGFLPSTSIESISLSARNESVRASVEFGRSFFRPISFRLAGARNEVLALEAQLKNTIGSTRRWESALIAPFDHHIPTGFLVYGAICGALAVIAFGVGYGIDGMARNSPIMLTAGSVLTVGLGWSLIPTMVFAIGRWQRWSALMQKIASWVFLTLGIGTAVNWTTTAWNPFQP